mmetsp:Transcript_21695/g.46906  ORF Transcript_21695/g.46906 Transcript_21695/m.46906 type:complete len:103 (+) Transcript_21695:380-688(+)
MAATPPPLHHRRLLLLLFRPWPRRSRKADLDDSTARLSTDRIHVEAMRLSNQQAAEELDEQRTEIRAVQDTLRTTQSAQDSRDATLVDKQRELEDSDSALLR